MERDQGKRKVAAAEEPVLALKSTSEPLAPPRTTRSAAKRGDENSRNRLRRCLRSSRQNWTR
jgi:hypothetical protein